MEHDLLNKRYNFTILAGGSFDQKYVFGDIKSFDNVKILDKRNFFSSRPLSLLFSISYSQRVNKYIRPITKSWFYNSFLSKCKFNNSKQLIIIFEQGWYDKELVKWLRLNHPEIITVLYCMDTIGFYSKHIATMDPKSLGTEFNYVLCYNPDDVKEYGYIYTNAFFSKSRKDDIAVNSHFDISFVGQAKDRLKLIEDLYLVLCKKYKVGFFVAGVKKEDRRIDGIKYLDKNMSYEEYLGIEFGSKCIVELVKGDTAGCTFRAWEAVYYNKKLLTNWKGIKDFKYYNPSYMSYFQNAADIDFDFLNRNDNIEYNYENDNSPIMLLEKISGLVNNTTINESTTKTSEAN